MTEDGRLIIEGEAARGTVNISGAKNALASSLRPHGLKVMRSENIPMLAMLEPFV